MRFGWKDHNVLVGTTEITEAVLQMDILPKIPAQREYLCRACIDSTFGFEMLQFTRSLELSATPP